MNDQPKKDNTADKISDILQDVSDVTDAVNQAGINSGKAGLFIRLGSLIAGLFGKRRK